MQDIGIGDRSIKRLFKSVNPSHFICIFRKPDEALEI